MTDVPISDKRDWIAGGGEMGDLVRAHLEPGRLRNPADSDRNRLHLLFHQVPAAIAVLRGPTFLYELSNPSYEELVQRRDLVGKTLLEAFPEVEGQPIHAVLQRVFSTGERFVGNDLLIPLARLPGGAPDDIYFDLVYEPFRGADGAVDGITVVAFDVTERVRSGRERERLLLEREALLAEREKLVSSEHEARAAAERALLAKDEFLAMLGHELRNPLAPIVNALELLRMRDGDATANERTIIERQVKHLTTLVDDLLDVSAITRGKIDLKRERIELRLVLDRAIEIAGPLLEQRDHDLIVKVPRQGLLVDADPIRLAQVLSNLLTNAAKYTGQGGRIVVSAAASDGEVELRVVDNGIGISEEMLPHVFELFAQERQSIDRARGGLGLGLAIVQNLTTMHGGSVRATSAGRGQGSTFTIRLPCARSTVAPAVGAGPALPFPLTTATRCKVLVVDDNLDAAETMAVVLASLGCETCVAHDGPSALALTRSFRPHLGLLDIGLPGMDGYELARTLRQHPATSTMRLVAATGYGQKRDIELALQAGFDEHLVKPIAFDVLQAMLARAILHAGTIVSPA